MPIFGFKHDTSEVETITFYIFYKFTIHCNYLHDLYCYICNINLDMSLVYTITVLNIILHAQSCQRFLRKRNPATPPSPRKKWCSLLQGTLITLLSHGHLHCTICKHWMSCYLWQSWFQSLSTAKLKKKICSQFS